MPGDQITTQCTFELQATGDNGSTITATFVVDIPFRTDETGTPLENANDTQDLLAQLDALTVTLTQVDAN